MRPTLPLLTVLLLAPLALLQAADHTPYPVAKFAVEHAVINQVYPQWSPKMGYNHDSDITKFKGRYVAVWNALKNRGPASSTTSRSAMISSIGRSP